MSTIKVNTIQTVNGTGEIKVSNPVLQGHTTKVDGINDGDGVLGTGSQIQLHGTTPVLDIFSYSETDSSHGGINFMKSASNTVGTNTKVSDSDIVGSIQFGGYDGNDYASIAGKIDFQMGGAQGGIGADDTAGEMVFYTTPDGAGGSGSTERLRITHTGDTQVKTGNLVMSTSQKGVDFSNFTSSDTAGTHQGTPTVTGHVLMDYEEGTWTGEFRGKSGSTSTGTTATGLYTKIGRMVYITITFNVVTPGGYSAEPQVRGLPFRAHGAHNFAIHIGFNTFTRLNGSGTNTVGGAFNGDYIASVTAGQSFIYIAGYNTAVSNWQDVNAGSYHFNGWYMTND